MGENSHSNAQLDSPGGNRCLHSWPADGSYLVRFMLLLILLDLFVAQAHLLDGLSVDTGMVSRRQPLPA